MIHLLVPMSGQGVRYREAGYNVPKPLVPVSGITMISRVLENYPTEWPACFVMADNHLQTKLPEELKRLRPSGTILSVPVHSEGPLRAIEKGLENIPPDSPVLVSYCDYGMVWDAKQFERFVNQTKCDAAVISYRGFHAHYLSQVKYAYSRVVGERVVEVREKGSFTDDREAEYASTGGYYFRTARILKEAIEYQRANDIKVNNEFYTSLTVEALLRKNPKAHVRVFEIPGFFQWGTPQDLKSFEYWEKTFEAYNETAGLSPGRVGQVLMPMAGKGSRFTAITETPKPFMSINGRAMFLRALDSLPLAEEKNVIVALKNHKDFLVREQDLIKKDLVLLDETPEGQALSTQAGVGSLIPNKSVIVSSCDHGIVLRPEVWENFQSNPDCEAAIFTIRGFPGANLRPEAFAYVSSEEGKFPLVNSVSVKAPISKQPSNDQLLVGTFWFQNAEIINRGIKALVDSGERVNGEIYLDSIFKHLIQAGLKVRTIPLDGYINWGDPASLSEALYWYEIYCGRRIERRSALPGVK